MKHDFVDIEVVCPQIVIDIRYATENNFVGKKVYSIPKCFLRPSVAKKLERIQNRLHEKGLGLKIWDGYRPHHVQKIFWDFLPDPRYIGNPKFGSKHNRGAAVDVTLIDETGTELLMPTPFDSFSEKAHRDCTNLPQEILENRNLLENSMKEEGFIPHPNEWWHFDDEDWQSYPVEDISLDTLSSN